MSTANHTPLAYGGPLTSAAMEAPLGQLDAAIVALLNAIGGTVLPFGVLTGSAGAGQKVLPMANGTAPFVSFVGASVFIGDISGTYEVGTIASIQTNVSLTLSVNLTNTYAAGKMVSCSPSEVVNARGGYGTLGLRLAAVAAIGGSGVAFPGSPSAGDLFRRTDRGGSQYVYTGAAWTQTNVPNVTAFWGTPSTEDRCYRTDRNIEYFYDGTRWLSSFLYLLPFGPTDIAFNAGVTAVCARLTIPTIAGTYDVWIEAIDVNVLPMATNDGTHYWTVTARKTVNATSANLGATFTTAADTAGAWTRHSIAVGALLGPTEQDINVNAGPTNTPGTLYFSGLVRCRLVG
jgi:hypothetical protein